MIQIIYTIDQVAKIVEKQIIPLFSRYSIFTLTGPLGAGKTTLVKEILRQFAINETITSPTFTYVNTYKNKKNQLFHHFDLYRIDKADDFIAAGFDEYLHEQDAFCIVEWPEVIGSILSTPGLKKRTCSLVVSYDENDIYRRILQIS